MKNLQVTGKERECIVAIEELKSNFPPRLSQVAGKLGIKPPTAFVLVRQLEKKGLVEEAKGSIILTSRGKEVYKNIILAHRSLETLLCRAGIPLECACKEAEKIDYLIEPAYAKKLWKYLGKPKNCPHGRPVIPVSV